MKVTHSFFFSVLFPPHERRDKCRTSDRFALFHYFIKSAFVFFSYYCLLFALWFCAFKRGESTEKENGKEKLKETAFLSFKASSFFFLAKATVCSEWKKKPRCQAASTSLVRRYGGFFHMFFFFLFFVAVVRVAQRHAEAHFLTSTIGRRKATQAKKETSRREGCIIFVAQRKKHTRKKR